VSIAIPSAARHAFEPAHRDRPILNFDYLDFALAR
jgi:hypothetical protein